MTLRAIVAALGGDLYANGRRANVPAPGHSRTDRSVSLLLEQDKVIVHSFGAAEWREVLDDLRRRGLIDGAARRLLGSGSVEVRSGDRPAPPIRLSTARTLWDGGIVPAPSGVVARHLALRHVAWAQGPGGLREHPAAALSVYRAGGPVCRAMMAGIHDPDGALTAVELTYLTPAGRSPPGLRIPRKMVGVVPPGSAVRLSALSRSMVVAEGVITTLSAMARFQLPGWALLSAGNLARWRPPPGIARVLIAGDRGAAGEAAALRLRDALRRRGVAAGISLPPPPWGDWNEAALTEPGGEEEGRSGTPARRG